MGFSGMGLHTRDRLLSPSFDFFLLQLQSDWQTKVQLVTATIPHQQLRTAVDIRDCLIKDLASPLDYGHILFFLIGGATDELHPIVVLFCRIDVVRDLVFGENLQQDKNENNSCI